MRCSLSFIHLVHLVVSDVMEMAIVLGLGFKVWGRRFEPQCTTEGTVLSDEL